MTSKGAPQVRARASASGTALTLLGCHGSGEYLAPPGGVARVVRSNSVQMTPGGGAKSIADVGLADPVFLRAVTALARQALPAAHPTALAAGLGDLRLHRVFISSVAQGVWLKGA